jgi:hypothetical protein
MFCHHFPVAGHGCPMPPLLVAADHQCYVPGYMPKYRGATPKSYHFKGKNYDEQ